MSGWRYLAAACCVFAAAVAVGVFVMSRAAASRALPYAAVRYDVADARRAFATQGVRLVVRSRRPWLGDLTSDRDVLEVSVFGDPSALRRVGFHDLEHGPDCTVAGHLALHWQGNVRAILNCDLVRDDRAWVARMDRALARLG